MSKLFSNISDKSVLLYLSSGDKREEYLSLPYDKVILSDIEIKNIKKADEKIILLPYDNNNTLRLLIDSCVKVNCVVGITDGCSEGGNYECINNPSFFGRLMPLLADECLYISDHMSGNTGYVRKHFMDVPFTSNLLLDNPSFVYDSFKPSYSDTIRVWQLKRMDTRTRTGIIGNIMCSVSHQSIWEQVNQLNGFFLPDYDNRIITNYCPARANDFRHIPRYHKDIAGMLNEAIYNRWYSIGIVPFADGEYQQILDTISGWRKEYPKQIYFYHMQYNDMKTLRDVLKNL